MIVFKKENGHPITIKIKTEKHSLINDDGPWDGLKSSVLDENNKILTSFFHKDLSARKSWVKGFFAAIEYLKVQKES